MKTAIATPAILALTFFPVPTTYADTFGSGANQFDIEFVSIGNPDNPDDTTGTPNPAGKVEYAYRMGEFEISRDMITKANNEGGLGITLHPMDYFGGPRVDEWYKAAYYDPTAGVYFLYPTGSDDRPTSVASGTAADTAVWHELYSQGPADITLAGGLSPYGTMGQGGNVWEWEETELDLVNDFSSSARGIRGGDWESILPWNLRSTGRDGRDPLVEYSNMGFRVASIPEPSTMLLGAMAAGGLLVWRRR